MKNVAYMIAKKKITKNLLMILYNLSITPNQKNNKVKNLAINHALLKKQLQHKT